MKNSVAHNLKQFKIKTQTIRGQKQTLILILTFYKSTVWFFVNFYLLTELSKDENTLYNTTTVKKQNTKTVKNKKRKTTWLT